MGVNEKMTQLANSIRALTGQTGKLSLDSMDTNLEVANTDKKNMIAVLKEIGIDIDDNASLSDIADLLPTIEAGLDTSDATATSDDILSGKTAYVDGEKITGTIATKTSSNLTASGATVIVPAGYYTSQATKSVATVTQATPSISVDSAGKITATATQTAGYVTAGTKSGTKQLTTQAAKTITPSTSSQTAVAKNVYTTGAVTVAAIPSNYEDVGTETAAYTSKITSLETAITALETELAGKASGGSGSAGIETCTVNINFTGGASGYPGGGGDVKLMYPKVTSGAVEYVEVTINSDNASINDMHKGSIFMLWISDPPSIFGGSGLVCQNLNVIYYSNLEALNYSSHFSFFISDSSGTITIN